MCPHDSIHRDGFALLRLAVPADWLDGLRTAFDDNVQPSDAWPVPRGADWRHAMVDLEPVVGDACRLPVLLAAVGALVGERFFLSQVEGREPLPGGGYQGLHRDFSARRPGDTVNAIVFLDDYGPANGATRLLPGSHHPAPGESGRDPRDETGVLQLEGKAGDILVFDADLLHAASLNRGGGRRRSLLATYFAEGLREVHAASAPLRNVRMDTSESFEAPATTSAG